MDNVIPSFSNFTVQPSPHPTFTNQDGSLSPLIAPSKPSKHPSRNARPNSPTQHHQHARSSDLLQPPASSSHLPTVSAMPAPPTSGWNLNLKVPGAGPGPHNLNVNMMKTGMNLVEKIQPLSFLQPPEEQTDNWDDDFEEGISFTKLQGSFAPRT